MDQSVMVFAGTAARASAIPTPSAGMVAYSTATSLQVYDGSAWVDLSTGYGVATGGASTAITVGGTAYTLLTFTSDSTLTVTKAGLFDVFVLGGGGGSSNGGGNAAGGGGAGQLTQTTAYFSTNQTVTIGAGGALNSLTVGTSRCGGIFALGGSGFSSVGAAGSYGASGAGGEGFGSLRVGGSAQINTVTGYGGGNNSGEAFGGGGGGMGGAGGTASGAGGAAGLGVSNSFNSVATTYARGGFGGATGQGVSNALANTGNGGANTVGNYGAGGSGLVMVRFRI